MTTSYNILTEDRKRHPLIYQCFGLLNNFTYLGMEHLDKNSPFYRGSVYHETIAGDPSRVLAVEYAYEQDIGRHLYDQEYLDSLLKSFLEEIELFFDAFPWVKTVAKINKRLGVIRVKARGVPADKLMFVLAASRNLAISIKGLPARDEAYTEFKKKKREMMPDYATYWIFTNLMSDSAVIEWDSSTRPLPRTWMSDPIFNNESNVINAATFGKKSLKRLLSGEEPKWYQDNFDTTYDGYCRDDHFEQQEVFFGTREYLWEKDLDDYEGVPMESSGRLLFRTLADTLSVEWDQECIVEGGEYDPYVGFMYPLGDAATFESVINNFLKAIEE